MSWPVAWWAPVAIGWAAWVAGRTVMLGVRAGTQRGATRLARTVSPGASSLRDDFTPDEREQVLAGPVMGWSRLCRRCWRRRATQADHLIPARLGGPGTVANAAPLCGRCNRMKGARVEWWAVARWLLPSVGWRCPIPGPLLAATVTVAVILTMRGTI